MNKKTVWETRYLEDKTAWDRGEVNPQLEGWLDEGILNPCKIIVPGCGKGHEVIRLATEGFDVVALDIAPTPVQFLRMTLSERSLSGEVHEADVLHWKSDAQFDAIYEQTSLCALDPELWLQYVQQLYAWLKPGGVLFVLFLQTNQMGGPPYHCGLSRMQDLFKRDRWRWSEQINEIIHPAGYYELVYTLEKI